MHPMAKEVSLYIVCMFNKPPKQAAAMLTNRYVWSELPGFRKTQYIRVHLTTVYDSSDSENCTPNCTVQDLI